LEEEEGHDADETDVGVQGHHPLPVRSIHDHFVDERITPVCNQRHAEDVTDGVDQVEQLHYEQRHQQPRASLHNPGQRHQTNQHVEETAEELDKKLLVAGHVIVDVGLSGLAVLDVFDVYVAALVQDGDRGKEEPSEQDHEGLE